MAAPLARILRTSQILLAAAVVLSAAASAGLVAWDGRQTQTAAMRATADAADQLARTAGRAVGDAMGWLDILASTWDPSAPTEQTEAALHRALAAIPGARFLAVQDAHGRMVQAIGNISADTIPSHPFAVPPPNQIVEEREWEFSGTHPPVIGRRLTTSQPGRILLGLDQRWCDAFLAPPRLGAPAVVLLISEQGVMAAGCDSTAGSLAAAPLPPSLAAMVGPASPATPFRDTATNAAWHMERRPLVTGQLDLAVALDLDAALRPWRQRAVAVGGLFVGLLLLLGGLMLALRRGLGQLRDSGPQQAAQMADVAQRLFGLKGREEIVARAEAIGRSLFGRQELAIRLGPSPAGEAGGPGVQLRKISGEQIGEIRLAAPLSAEDQTRLETFARVVVQVLITEQVCESLGAERQRLEAVLANAPWGLLRIDRDWRILYANAAAGSCLGGTDMVGKNLRDLLPGLRESHPEAQLKAAAEQGRRASLHAYSAATTCWYELCVAPLPDGAVICLRDMTPQRKQEDRLRQAQKLEAIGQLAGGIAHDVNNLLTVILGNLELLSLRAEDRRNGIPDTDPDPNLDTTLAEAALRAGESATQLMHRLLSFSRRQPPRPQVVEVDEVLQGLQPMLQHTLSEQISLRIHWPADLWPVFVSASELESALLNLSINAQDAMPGGGSLTIQAANVAIDRAYAAVAGVEHTGDYVMICVADTGTGMAKEVLNHAPDPFFTTKEPGKGTGLGLSMVYGFARQNGGHVLLDSEPGQGTAVRVYLPRAGQPPPAPGPAEPPVAAGGHEAILLVEDNELVRAHTEAMLVGLGYRVRAAADGAAALAVLGEEFQPDLLITDVILPGRINGRDVAEQAQAKLPGLRVLFTSGYSGNVLIENGRLPPGVDLLGKPFRRSELAARIRAQLAAAHG